MSITTSDRSVSRRGVLGATLLFVSPISAGIAQPVPVATPEPLIMEPIAPALRVRVAA